MGQAKRRGTFEQRQVAAIERDEKRKEIEKSQEPERRKARHISPALLAMMAMSGYYGYENPHKRRP